jgi:hypothetical protein
MIGNIKTEFMEHLFMNIIMLETPLVPPFCSRFTQQGAV